MSLKPPRRILIAPDSFKGCLSAAEVAGAMARSVRRALPHCEAVELPVADGGEGFSDAQLASCGGKRFLRTVSDPLGQPVEAAYCILTDGTAVIGTAAASGLPLLSEDERAPLITSSFGTGELIRDAIGNGCRNILVGLGGSATHDAGTGLLSALGFRFLDEDGRALKGCGANLDRIRRIDRSSVLPALKEVRFTAACDVQTVICGPGGAAEVFAPQKGADPGTVHQLDEGTARFAALILAETGIDLRSLPGSGAAGGIGGALAALLGARLVSGIDLVLDAAGFDALLQNADLVLTGEGRIDAQSGAGKAVWGVLQRARRAGVPVIAIGGRVTADAGALPFAGCYALADENVPDQVAMQPERARNRIADLVGQILLSESFTG